MTNGLACVMCAIDPQTTSVIVPMAQATVIALPFFFREQIVAAIRRVRRDALTAAPDEGCDTRPDDQPDEPSADHEPPGGVSP